MTLTVDPKRFESGEDAYDYVRRNGLIRRFLRLMGFKKAWVWMEFHAEKAGRPDGREWPHWHVVVDLSDFADGWVEYRRLWRLWGELWGIGAVRMGDKAGGRKRRRVSAFAAAYYALGYAKAKNGVGDWVLNRGPAGRRSPRAFEVYGLLREAMRQDGRARRPVVVEVDEGAEVVRRGGGRASRTVGERVRLCGAGSELVREIVYADGYVVHAYVGKLRAATPETLLWAWQKGLLRGCGVVMIEGKSFGPWPGAPRAQFFMDLCAWSLKDALIALASEDASAVLSAGRWRPDFEALRAAAGVDGEWLAELAEVLEPEPCELVGDLGSEVPEYVPLSDGSAPF
jgi:hypothetical protein